MNVLENDALSYTTVKQWLAEFKRDRSSIADKKQMGRLKTATTKEIIAFVHNVVVDHWTFVWSRTSTEWVFHISKKECYVSESFIN